MSVIRFTPPGSEVPVEFPAPWNPTVPAWLRQSHRTIVFVIDDQIQRDADLTDETRLRTRVLDPLNVAFQYAPACARSSPLARGGKWFDTVLSSIREKLDHVAAVFLDLMFDGENDPQAGAGLKFLGRLSREFPRLPVLMRTNARDADALRTALARSGLHCGFLPKEHSHPDEQLAAALYEHGWIADPTFGAFSQPMREAVARLRSYAVRQPRLIDALGHRGMPLPLLITADSGQGKTRTATLAAEWLMRIRPPLTTNIREGLPRPGGEVVLLSCSALVGRDQGTKVALFGKGIQDPSRERKDASGLVDLGAVQKASGGVLILDELGNSNQDLQRMLLNFVETGTAEPEFPQDSMTAAARGPLDLVCIFTAQPAHIASDRIIPDLQRRCSRGGTIVIPPLAERLDDLTPLILSTLLERWPENRTRIEQPGGAILPEVLARLREAVVEQNLSVSGVLDLFGDAPAGHVIGLPFLEARLDRLLPTTRTSAVPKAAAPIVPPTAVAKPSDIFALVDSLRSESPLRFPDSREQLQGRLRDVAAAAAELLLGYLEAAIRAAGSNFAPAELYRIITGEMHHNDANDALTAMRPFLVLDKETTLNAIRNSDALASLAIKLAGKKPTSRSRSKEMRTWLEGLLTEPGQLERLARLGLK